MKTKIWVLTLFLIAIISSCRTYTDPLTYSTYEPRAIAAESDQTYLLRVQGKGLTREDAVNNALEQTVRDIIFKDIHVTYGDHKPLMRLINNPADEQNHAEFFNKFFSSNGNYLLYISPVKKNREFYSSGSITTVIMNVKVERGALKAYLAEMEIIK